MDKAAEQYDLISALWRLDGFNRIGAESGQDHSVQECIAAKDIRRVGRLRKLVAWLGRLAGQ